MSATTVAMTRTVDIEMMAQTVTAFMLGSKQPTRAFGQALAQLGHHRTPDGADVEQLTDELGREIGWYNLMAEVDKGSRPSLLAIVTSVLRKHF